MSSTIDLTVTHRRGGMLLFMKKGIYQNVLWFHSPSLKRTWSVKRDNKKEKGSLKLKGKVVFNYVCDDVGIRARSVKDGKPNSDWQYLEMEMQLCD